MMNKIKQLFLEFKQMQSEGTLLGVLRYIRFKRLCRQPEKIKKISTASVNEGIGIVGAGTYTAAVHLPCLKACSQPMRAIVSYSGKTARALASIYGIEKVYSGVEELVTDKNCDSLLIATPHYLHPKHILMALDFGNYIFCEKPVAIDATGIDLLVKKALPHPFVSKLMIGFNRRFAPAIKRLRQESWVKERKHPMIISYKVNFGPKITNAMSDPQIGGGRIHGAVCHYVDMIAFLANVPITTVSTLAILDNNGKLDENSFVTVMALEDGSVANLIFNSESKREYDAKEEIYVYSAGHTARIVDYSNLWVDGKRHRYYRHKHGAMAAMKSFLDAKKNKTAVSVGLVAGINATSVTLAMQESLRQGGIPVSVSNVKGA